MKKFLILGVAALVSLTAAAEVTFKSIGSKDGKMEVVMEDAAAGDNVMVTSAKLINDGREVYATMMMCGLQNGVASYTLTFPMQKSFVNPQIALVVNGNENVTDITSGVEGFLPEVEEDVCTCGCQD